MNKYLEKIAARINTHNALRTGSDVYALHKSRKKKKKATKSAQASRKWNRAAIRNQD